MAVGKLRGFARASSKSVVRYGRTWRLIVLVAVRAIPRKRDRGHSDPLTKLTP